MNAIKQQLLNELIGSLRDAPNEWRWGSDDQAHIWHQSGVRLWVLNGSAYAWMPNIRFGFWGERRLRRAFKQWRRVHGIVQISEIDERNCLRALTKLRNHRGAQ